jgi:hypothetical protein
MSLIDDPLELKAIEIHQQNELAGWWDDWPHKPDRHGTAMALVVSEFAEAIEGARKDLMDDHLPQFKMFAVEIADANIRLLDLAGAYEINMLKQRVAHGVDFLMVDLRSKQNHLEAVWRCIGYLTRSSYREDQVVDGIAACYALARRYDIDLDPVIDAKLEYNRHRADHKPEARAAKGGKKW